MDVTEAARLLFEDRMPAGPLVASAFKNDAHDHRGRFAPKGQGVPVSDPDEAIDLIVGGSNVTMAIDDVGPLFDKLAARSDSDPLVDLGKVTIDGSGGLFCGHSKGIAREDMPQLVGNIKNIDPGAKAAQVTPDDRGYVSIESEFRAHLAAQGVSIVDEDAPVAELRPTQKELDGRKSAQIAARIEAGTFPDDQRIFVSSDGYIVDGHHRWAANVGIDARDGGFADVTMPVARVDMPIMEILSQAVDFAEEWGIPQRAHGESALTVYRMAMARARLYQAFANDAHDHKGRFAPKGTGVTPEIVDKIVAWDTGEPFDDSDIPEPMAKGARAWISGPTSFQPMRAKAAAITGIVSTDAKAPTGPGNRDAQVASLLDGIAAAPPTTVVRGLRLSAADADALVAGGKIADALATTTTNEDLAREFAAGFHGGPGYRGSNGVGVLVTYHDTRALPITPFHIAECARNGVTPRPLLATADEHLISGRFTFDPKSVRRENVGYLNGGDLIHVDAYPEPVAAAAGVTDDGYFIPPDGCDGGSITGALAGEDPGPEALGSVESDTVTTATDRAAIYAQFANPHHDKGNGRFKRKGAPDTPGRPGMGDLKPDTSGWVQGVDGALDHIDPATGDFTEERKALHDKIIEEHLADAYQNDGELTAVMLGGGSGAGKGAVQALGLVEVPPGSVKIDPDELKLALPEGQAGSEARDPKWACLTHEESSHLAKRLQQAAIERGLDVVVDGTGDSGYPKLEKKVGALKNAGYKIDAFYVTCPTAEAVTRAKKRSEKPPYRLVEAPTVEAIHHSVSRVVPLALRDGLYDSFQLWDTSAASPRKVASQEKGGQLDVADNGLWSTFLAKANEPPVFQAAAAAPRSKGIPADEVSRIVVEVTGGLDQASSTLAPLSPAQVELWNALLSAQATTAGEGLTSSPPGEWPDPVGDWYVPVPGSKADRSPAPEPDQGRLLSQDDTEPPAPSQEATMRSTTFATAPMEGDQVRWTDDIGDHTGVVVEATGPEPTGVDPLDPEGDPASEGQDPSVVVVVPDDAPDQRVEVPVDAIEVVAAAAEDAPTPPPAPGGHVRMAQTDVSLDGPVVQATDDETMSWFGLLVVEGTESGDRRMIGEGALTWRELPLPLMVMFRNPDGGEGHAAAELAGRIDKVWRHKDRPNELWGSGVYDDSPVGREAYRLLKTKMMRGVSVDLDAVDIAWEAPDGTDLTEGGPAMGGRMKVQTGRVMGATQTAFPAFAEAHLEIGDEALVASAGIEAIMHTVIDEVGALVASAGAGPERPPTAWFGANPNVDGGAYPVRMDLDGRVHGYVAAWGTCHIGFAERCVSVPKSSCSYAAFRTGQVLTAEGDLIAVGPIVTDTVHPDLRMRASDAQTFYSHTGATVADVAVHEDRNGIYVAGAARPAATSDQIRAFRGGDVSPDWRHVNGRGLECVAMLVVNNSGFKVTQALAASAGGAGLDYIDTSGSEVIVPGQVAQGRMELATGEVTALVAAGRLPRHHATATELRMEALERQVTQLTSQLLPFRRAAALARLGRDPGAAFVPIAPTLDAPPVEPTAEAIADDERFVEDGEFIIFEEPAPAPAAP